MFFSEEKIPLIVRGDRHDGAGTVFHQDIIRDPDWNFFAVDRIDRVLAGKDAFLLYIRGSPYYFTLSCDFIDEFLPEAKAYLKMVGERPHAQKVNNDRKAAQEAYAAAKAAKK